MHLSKEDKRNWNVNSSHCILEQRIKDDDLGIRTHTQQKNLDREKEGKSILHTNTYRKRKTKNTKICAKVSFFCLTLVFCVLPKIGKKYIKHSFHSRTCTYVTNVTRVVFEHW